MKLLAKVAGTLQPLVDKLYEKNWINLPITGGAINSSWDMNWWQQGKNLSAGAEDVATVHACVDAYAETMATLYGKHYKENEDGSKTEIVDSPLSRVLHNPNHYQTRSDLMLNLIKNLLLRGNGYLVCTRNSRNEIETLQVMPSAGTMPYVDPESKAIFYAFGDNPMAKKIDVLIPQRDVLHIRLYTPRHPLVGVSPIDHAASAIAANAAISSHQAVFFNQMSRPSGVLSTDMKLNLTQMLELRAAWEAQAKDMNSGKVPILANGTKWQQLSLSSQDSEMVAAFNMTINDIARCFRVPLAMVQQHSEGSTYNNVEQLFSHWLAGGLGFLLEHTELAFSKFFGLPRGEFTEFDADTLLRTDFKGRVEGVTRMVQGGVMTINEGRRRMGGMKPVEHGDTPIVQQQMVPLGWTQPEPEPEPEPEPIDPEEAKMAAVISIKRAMR